MASREQMSTSFGVASAAYEAGRPEYPGEAAAWLLAPVSGRVRLADVGAGTGKLLRSIMKVREVSAVAVDPDAAMLAALAERTPEVQTLVGTAENLSVADGSFDAVVMGQAWHWVEPVAASREIGRALRPGGVLGLIWNTRDERVGWVRELTSRLVRPSSAEEMVASGEIPAHAPFGELEAASWEWERVMNRSDIEAMVRSRSYFITASADDQAAMMAGVAALLDDLGVVGAQTIAMPYVTRAYRAVRP